MGVLAPLVLQAQPRLVDFDAQVTAGATWRFELTGALDPAGEPIDFSDVSITWECKVFDKDTEVAEFTVTGGSDGSILLEVDEADTEGTDAGSTSGDNGRRCTWYLVGDDGTDRVQFWGPADSLFIISKGVTP